MLFRTFLLSLLLSPLFFGANRPWAWSLYALLIACIGMLYFVNALMQRKGFDILIGPLKYPLALVLIPIAWAFVQVSPWAPQNWVHPFWGLAAQQLPTAVTPSISLSPAETMTALMKLISYLLVFFLSFQFNRHSDKANTTFKTIAYFGAAYAVYGLYAFWGNENILFGFENSAGQGSVRSTFVNRNSYATYAGLSLLALFPLLLERVKGSLIYGINNYYGLQYFIENFIIRAWLPILIGMTIFFALFLSHSRGGFLSSTLAILVFFTTLSFAGKLKKGKALLILLTSLIMTISFWNSSDVLLERMEQISLENNGRLEVYRILDNAISENYWLGTGYGSFEKSFRLYRDEAIRGYYTKAHNSYLENMFELGVIQACALFCAMLLVATKCLQGIWKRKRNWVYPAVGFSATVLVATHALVDFSLQIPAVAYIYALIMGAALAQSLSREQRLSSS